MEFVVYPNLGLTNAMSKSLLVAGTFSLELLISVT